jgi:hypothetical protein
MTMKFVKTVINEDDRKTAVFQYGDAYYLYSYSRQENLCDEVMVFRCTPGGDVVDYAEVTRHHGYVDSKSVMSMLEATLKQRKEIHNESHTTSN